MSDIDNPEQEDFEAQVTDSVLADEEEVKATVQKTADKAIGRSRSRSTSKHKSRSHRSRSRSRSYSRSRRRRHRSRSYGSRHRSSRYREGRSHSRSPMSDRRRHHGDRENPTESSCLGVFGLSLYTTERDLRDVYEHYGTLNNVNVVYDHQTGRSRGFAFVMFTNTSDAAAARESTNGTEVDGRRIRVDFSITERAHTPTPGVYMGKPTSNKRDFNRGSGDTTQGVTIAPHRPTTTDGLRPLTTGVALHHTTTADHRPPTTAITTTAGGTTITPGSAPSHQVDTKSNRWFLPRLRFGQA